MASHSDVDPPNGTLPRYSPRPGSYMGRIPLPCHANIMNDPPADTKSLRHAPLITLPEAARTRAGMVSQVEGQLRRGDVCITNGLRS